MLYSDELDEVECIRATAIKASRDSRKSTRLKRRSQDLESQEICMEDGL